MKERPTMFIAACIFLAVCMSAFLQCASHHTMIEMQDGFVENNSRNIPNEEPTTPAVTVIDAEN